jgi:cytochrome b subunit of formate dehydrogenase
MKKIIFLFAVLFFVKENSRAQDSLHNITPAPSMKTEKKTAPAKFSKEYYEIKSRKLKTNAWILLGAGTVLGVTGVILYNNQKDYDLNHLDEAIVNEAGYEVMMIGGAAMVVTSIPLFITSAKYKKKALNMSATLKLESSKELYAAGITLKHYPAVGVRINF